MKYGVVFIHGLNKTPETWNRTEFGKEIDVEQTIRNKADTILVSVPDYTISPKEVMGPIVEQIRANPKKWIIVCHSLGVIHGNELLKHNLHIVGMVIIDPTPLNTEYLDLIRDRGWNDIVDYCTHELVTPAPSIELSIHLNYDEELPDAFARHIGYYRRFVGANDRSKIVIHPGKGHMIHYTDAPKIIRAITDMLR
jgi:hypothetical protein